MRAKLTYTQAIVEALAISDYKQIEHNAMRLVDLSQQGGWMVHDTMAYAGLSDDFRNRARTLAMGSLRNDLDLTTDHYAQLLDSCIACHDHLKQQRQTKDMPGAVSSILETDLDIRARADDARRRDLTNTILALLQKRQRPVPPPSGPGAANVVY